jgi:hypothetical protein
MLLDSAPSIDAYKLVAPMLMQLIITKGDINIGNLDNKDQDQNKTNSRAAGNGSIIMSKELIEIQRLESIQIPVVSKIIKAKERACNRVYGKHCRLTFL